MKGITIIDDELRDFKWYSGNLDWLQSRTIMLGRAGSHAYGTNLPTSDQDIRGVCIAPREYYLGFLNTFEQAETKSPLDCTVYDIRKYFKLAADCNPNVIEALFLDERDVLLTTPAWDRIRGNRNLFLSTKARHTFTGYAAAQLKRIKTHRRWLLDPPKGQPARTDYGLPEGQVTLGKEQLGVINAAIRKAEDSWGGEGFTKDALESDRVQQQLVQNALAELDMTMNLLPIVMAERRFTNACRVWAQYQTWLRDRNETRQELEAKYGYDTKHGMHLVRLLRMGLEIMTGRGVVVRRPDAEELLAIRAGAWSFDKMEGYALAMETAIAAAEAISPLRHSPDREALNALLVDVVGTALQSA